MLGIPPALLASFVADLPLSGTLMLASPGVPDFSARAISLRCSCKIFLTKLLPTGDEFKFKTYQCRYFSTFQVSLESKKKRKKGGRTAFLHLILKFTSLKCGYKSFCYIFRSFTCPSCMEPVDAALLGKISSLERQSINPRSDSHYMSLLDPDPGGTNFKQQVEKCMEIVNSLNFNTN